MNGWIKEQINTLELESDAQISDQFREGWERFSFPQAFLLPEQHERNALFFSGFTLILPESWQGNRKPGKN